MITVWDLTSETTTSLQLLALAFLLSGVIGAEREFQQKAAGLRTHILVGTGSATFTLVSVYGFTAMAADGTPHDPGRIAAQVVTGVGFLGAGVIFTRSNVVRGLTTAATIWVVAAVGMAAGAGLPVLAIAATALHLVAALVLAPIARHMPTVDRDRVLELRYTDGHGVLRTILETATEQGFTAAILSSTVGDDDVTGADGGAGRVVHLRASFTGKPPQHDLIRALAGLDGVLHVEGRHDDDRD
ncbi:MgtC/SapB family protein [Georgenia wangjunii]|uniref:MgtC/SapB family protein n=1 Tax=Georgenia wangjunii TaxID=3117730 RepID=UPI002F2656FB